jgi:biopolymer transport protein ExbD
MTPMVDVTFLLLIFFMVTASFTMQKSLNVPKPESNQPSFQARTIQDFQDNPDYIVVRVDGFSTFHVSAAAFQEELEAPSEQELLVRLRQARQGDAQGHVPSKMLVLASGEAQYERVVTAIDAGNDIGMEEVQLLNVEDDE